MIETGAIIDFAGRAVPPGYLECDGSELSRLTYSRLFSVIGTSWGPGDGTTTFNLPNLSRTTTMGRRDVSDQVGQVVGEEAHALAITEIIHHNHGTTSARTSDAIYSGDEGVNGLAAPDHEHDAGDLRGESTGSHVHGGIIQYIHSGTTGPAADDPGYETLYMIARYIRWDTSYGEGYASPWGRHVYAWDGIRHVSRFRHAHPLTGVINPNAAGTVGAYFPRSDPGFPTSTLIPLRDEGEHFHWINGEVALQSAGQSQPHNNMQPSAVTLKIIKV